MFLVDGHADHFRTQERAFVFLAATPQPGEKVGHGLYAGRQ
jgi:hypothetical protein